MSSREQRLGIVLPMPIVTGFGLQRSPEIGQGGLWPAGAQCHRTQLSVGARMLGIQIEDSPVERLGLTQATGLIVLERALKKMVDGRGCHAFESMMVSGLWVSMAAFSTALDERVNAKIVSWARISASGV